MCVHKGNIDGCKLDGNPSTLCCSAHKPTKEIPVPTVYLKRAAVQSANEWFHNYFFPERLHWLQFTIWPPISPVL